MTLKAGKELKLNLAAKQISASVPAGTYHVLVSVTDPSGATTTVDTGKTLVVAAAHVDLAGSFVNVPSVVKAGRQGTVELLIANHGNVEASGRLAVNLFASNDQSLAGATEILASPGKTVHIKPGKSVKLSLEFPAGAASSRYFLVAQLDPGDVFHTVSRIDGVFASAAMITVTG